VFAVARAVGGNDRFFTRRNEVDDGDARARFERREDRGVHPRGAREVMVDVAHEERVADGVGEVRFVLVAGDHRDLSQAARAHGRAQRREPLLTQLARVDAAVRTDEARGGDALRAVAGADLADRAALFHPDRLEDLLARMRRPWLRGRGDRDEQRDEETGACSQCAHRTGA
jgi:hypothetical protein